MRTVFVLAAALSLASPAFAAPNVTNATQKGSLLIFPDIRVDGDWNTLVRIQNDGALDVDLLCYWLDGNKHRVDFVVPVTKNQPVWIDAGTGQGTAQVNRFPTGPANGFENPFLPAPNGPAAYRKGLLACWAVDGGAQQQVKWNHLSGTATVYHPAQGAYEYTAYAFFVPTGLDQQPVGLAGTLNLNGVEYDSCPVYQIGILPRMTVTPAAAGTRTLLSDFGAAAHGPLGVAPGGVAVEASGQILVMDGAHVVDPAGGTGGRGALSRVDPTTGTRTLLSDFGAAAHGPLGVEPGSVAVEASGQILVVNAFAGTGGRGALLRVDPATGMRTLLSDFGAAAHGPLGVAPSSVAVEASGQILVVDFGAGTGGQGALFRVDPTTAMRTRLSDFGAVLQGPLGIDPVGVAVEASGQILVVDPNAGTGGQGALFRVDPTTGTRTLLSDFGSAAPGPLGVAPGGVAVEASGQILVVDPAGGTGGRGALVRIAPAGAPFAPPTRLTLAACTLNLQQDWVPVWTKWQIDLWNEDEIKFTGAYECSDSWHETLFNEGTQPVGGPAAGIVAFDDGIDAAAQNFLRATLGSDTARYRVQGVKSTQCENRDITTQAVGVVAVQASLFQNTHWVGTTLAAAGKFTGRIAWDPEGAVPEGGIR